ncbi:E3 ubiquitin-protein ligase MARCHF2 [Microplitis mediator]|uniref:E3 ubiquitin-protein ligase MARCHF2 n=1 Tax=Microplitis mediator TaxID=375433 RepID=UPI002556B968|nr:E3 ubiquitin-protein ligase MARCHF2 [Microplitis mediator]
MFETQTEIPDKGGFSHHRPTASTEDLSPQVRDSQSCSSNSTGQSERRLSPSLISVGSCVCRICHHPSGITETLVSPCRCKGTLEYVHLSCLERWLNQSCRNHCELCRYRFNAVETPRYHWQESLRIWMSHPRNLHHLKSDLVVLTLLTLVTLGLVVICLLGMRYFIIEGRKIGISRLWTRGAIVFFITIVILGYCTTVYLLVKEQLAPWYRWWKTTVNIRLVTESLEQQQHHQQGTSRGSIIPGHLGEETTDTTTSKWRQLYKLLAYPTNTELYSNFPDGRATGIKYCTDETG